jgi:flagellar motor component MotA
MNNEWLKTPERENFKVDKKKLMTKVNQWMDIIDGVLENAEDEDIEDAVKLVKKYREKLRKYRTCGLQKEGEYSYENLVFKFLRRNGYIAKLENFKNEFVDKKLSLEQENIE